MVYLPIITAIISGLLVWALGRWNASKDEHKQEKKRLHCLLYNMLELKHWVDKEVIAEPFIARYMEKMTAAIQIAVPDKSQVELAEMTAVISAGINGLFLNNRNFPVSNRILQKSFGIILRSILSSPMTLPANIS